MVCIYCSQATRVTNSRSQKRQPGTWRRRQCTACQAVFTTREHASLDESFRFQSTDGTLEPFWRDKLFIDVYESCRHRKTAHTDATALTDTIVQQILKLPGAPTGLIARDPLVRLAIETLRRFDSAAATHFAAFHKPS